MHCLVTGGAGFIGSNLVHELISLGHTVDIVDNLTNGFLENLEGIKIRHIFVDLLDVYNEHHENNRPPDQALFIEGDYTNPAVLRRIMSEKYDVVFHLAANPRVSYSVENPSVTTEENILNTVILAESIQRSSKKTRLVFSSSCAVYGNPKNLPVEEDNLKCPESPYGWQKSAAEDYFQMAAKIYNLDCISLRYFNVYGPRQRGSSPYSTAISAWCDKVANNASLRFDGDGSQTRDMIYVGDVVQANILAATSKTKFTGNVINIGTGRSTSNTQIMNVFKRKFKNLQIEYAPKRLGDVDHVYASVQNAYSVLQFKARVSLEEGLEKTFNWWNLKGE
jgi:UDP-glucose 4-epimerase